MIKKLSVCISTFLFAIFIWEHIAISNDVYLKPTYFIDTATIVFQEAWRLSGISFAYLGTYYEYLHLDKLGDTLLSLITSVYNLAMSVEYFGYGFKSIACLYDHPIMVYICSVSATLGLALSTYLCYKFKTCNLQTIHRKNRIVKRD